MPFPYTQLLKVPSPPKEPRTDKKPKNIVICCDGTGNEFNDSNSNVVKLYRALIIDNDQVGYYHPGVGTMGDPAARNQVEREWSMVTGLAFGAGFKDRVLDAYRYLMEVYDDGDQVYLFGFSRGAYTVRALAGLLHGYGLLCKGNEGHLLYAWRMYQEQHEERGSNHIVPNDAFRETFSHDGFTLHFVGVWDTVSSVGWIDTPLRLLNVAQDSTIKCGRHAVSIDERRCFFQDNLWGAPVTIQVPPVFAVPKVPPAPGKMQDLAQVWFAGAHSDVGGGYPQTQAALANITLEWMLWEGKKAGLLLEDDRVRLIFGLATVGQYSDADLYKTPDPYWPVHKSLHGPWWVLEFLPHLAYAKEDQKEVRRTPMSMPRKVPKGALIHESVVERMKDQEFRPKYQPKNLRHKELVRPAINPAPTMMDVSQLYMNATEDGPGSSAWGRWTVIILVSAAEIVLVLFVVLLLRCVGLWVAKEWMRWAWPYVAHGTVLAWSWLVVGLKSHLPHWLRTCWGVRCRG